jgi:hypothetical protein
MDVRVIQSYEIIIGTGICFVLEIKAGPLTD